MRPPLRALLVAQALTLAGAPELAVAQRRPRPARPAPPPPAPPEPDPTSCPPSHPVGRCESVGQRCEYDGCESPCVCEAAPDGGAPQWHCMFRCVGPLPPPELAA